MAKGYWIARVTVDDPDQYQNYVAVAPDVIKAHGGVYLARGGKSEQMEGDGRPRNVVVEFPSFDDAVTCYNSDAYQAAKSKRAGAGTAEIVIVEGTV